MMQKSVVIIGKGPSVLKSTKAFVDSVLKEYLEMLKEKKADPYFSIRLTGANTILINSIRDLKHDVSLSTVNNEWRVVLIFQAEKLCIPVQKPPMHF